MRELRPDATISVDDGDPRAADPVVLAGAGPVVLYPGRVVRLPLANRLVPLARVQLGLALIVLNLADVLLTKAIIQRGGVEGNPIMKGLMAGFAGPLGTKLAFSLIAALLLVMCPPTSRLADRAAAAVAGVYIAIVAWNCTLLGYLLLFR